MSEKAAIVRIVIPSDIAEVDRVCRAAKELLEGNGLIDRVFAVELLLREFVNNAILHGNNADVSKRVQVRIRVGRKSIMLSIADEGVGFDWRERQCHVADESDISGRGLAIGMEYARKVTYNRTGNRVVLLVEKTLDVNKGELLMEDSIVRSNESLRISLGEKLTATEAPCLQAILKREITDGARTIIFDFKATSTLDSTGIGLLVATSNSLRAAQGHMRLVNVSVDIIKLLRSMRLAERLNASAEEGQV